MTVGSPGRTKVGYRENPWTLCPYLLALFLPTRPPRALPLAIIPAFHVVVLLNRRADAYFSSPNCLRSQLVTSSSAVGARVCSITAYSVTWPVFAS